MLAQQVPGAHPSTLYELLFNPSIAVAPAPIVLCSGEHYHCGSCERFVNGGSDEMYLQEVRLGTRELDEGSCGGGAGVF